MLKFLLMLLILLLFQLFGISSVIKKAPMMMSSVVKDGESSSLAEVVVTGNLNNMNNKQLFVHFAFKIIGVTDSTNAGYFLLMIQNSSSASKVGFYVFYRDNDVRIGIYEYITSSWHYGSWTAVTPGYWYYIECELDNTSDLTINMRLYDDYMKTTLLDSAASGAMGVGLDLTPAKYFIQSAYYFATTSNGDRFDFLVGNCYYVINSATSRPSPGSITLECDNHWVTLFTSNDIEDDLTYCKEVFIYDDASDYFQLVETYELTGETSSSQTPQDNKESTTDWETELSEYLSSIAGKVGKIFTIWNGTITTPKPFEFFGEVLTLIWSKLVDTFDKGIDAILDGLKSFIKSLAYLIEGIHLAIKAITVSEKTALVAFFETNFVSVIRGRLEARINEITTWISNNLLSTSALELYGDVIISKLETKLAINTTVKRILELIHVVNEQFSIELRDS